MNALRPGPWAGWVAAVLSALRSVWPRPTPPPQEPKDPDWRRFDRPTVTRRGARIAVASAMRDWLQALYGVVVVAAGIPVYAVLRWRQTRRHAARLP